MKNFIAFFILGFLFSCSEPNEVDVVDTVIEENNIDLVSDVIIEIDTTVIKSDYDMGTVETKDQKEFLENLENIEEKYGEQWDFCTCIVKNDSINKAFGKELPDAEFDRLFARSDVIESKCKAFLVQSANTTPNERAKHEKKVRDCLKAAGIK